MAGNKKYYWLKLKSDFFKRHDIRIIEDMPNGEKYVLFYLKLLTESISHEGALRFNDTIPYSPKMLSTITNTDVDVVKTAINILQELKLVEIFDDGTYYMEEVQKMIGTETQWADKKREYRSKMKKDNVLVLSDKSIELEIEKDKELEIEKDEKPQKKQVEALFEELWKLYPERKGKASVSDKTKLKWFELGKDVFEKCLKRYVAYIKKTEYPYKNGSTFFNSGYVDYLDENYSSADPTTLTAEEKEVRNKKKKADREKQLAEEKRKSDAEFEKRFGKDWRNKVEVEGL